MRCVSSMRVSVAGPVWLATGKPSTIALLSTKPHGMYEITYTTTGSATRHTSTKPAGRPKPQPMRSQPSAAGAAGSVSLTGSSTAGGGASGPNPSRPASENVPATANEATIAAKAACSGVNVNGPAV